MPNDGYVIARAGASNNSTMTMLTLVITVQNTVRVAEILLEEPYAEATLSSPYLMKNTPVTIEIIMNASEWTYETRGNINFVII